MAFTLSSPRLSFIQFPAGPEADVMLVAEPNDLAFQFQVNYDSIAAADATEAAADNTTSLRLVNKSGATVHNYSTDGLYLQRYRTGDQQLTFIWLHGLPNIDQYLDCDNCFNILVLGNFDVTNGSIFNYLSNTLQYVCDTEFTSVLQYRCNENSYGFKYCDVANFANRARLPIWMFQPQFEDDETVNFDSEGNADVLKSVTREVYECQADYATKVLHERIKAALSHDIVTIANDEYSGGIRKNGNYEINWPELKVVREAPASFKVFVTPYLVRNSNCATC